MKLCASCKNGFFGSPQSCPVCQADLSDVPEIGGDALIGMVVGGRYELVELLGEGAMGRVYRGVHQGLQRAVAVKLLKTSAEAEPDLVRRFEQEARAISRLNHPHILSVIDFGRTPGGLLYLVTEFVKGGTLANLLARAGALPLARTLDIFHQILAAVEEAHSAQVIHRDLKPDNIVVTELRSGGDFVKVLDFGIATFGDDVTSRMTAKGGFVGTPGYMAPETIVEGRASEPSDVYSLGNVLFEMLTGRAAFVHDFPMALLNLHVNEAPPTLREALPGGLFAPELEKVAAKALAKDPAQRFASVAEFRSALMYAASQMGRLELRCDHCSRPRDPATGLCSLHGPSAMGTIPPPGSGPVSVVPTGVGVDVRQSTMVEQGAASRFALIQRTLGHLVGRDVEAERIVDCLVGRNHLLEIIGEPGSGRSALLDGFANAAASLGYNLWRMRPDPWEALRPWFPVRRLVGEIIDCDLEPEDSEEVLRAAAEFGVLKQHLAGLCLLFGFEPDDAPESRPQRMAAVQHAVFSLIAPSDSEQAGTCVIAEDVLDYDRASQSLVQYLALRIEELNGKLAVTTDTDFWPIGNRRTVSRLHSLTAPDVRLLIERELNLGPTEARTLAQQVFASTHGNAFHVWQAVNAHKEGSNAVQAPAEVLAGRLALLSQEARELLEYVSALGAEAPPDLLALLVGKSHWTQGLRELSDHGLVRDAADGTISPAHPSLAQAVLDALPREARRNLHARLVAKLKSAGESVFVLARHAYEAELAQSAYELAAQSGDEACAWCDEETAALHHYPRAVHVARWSLLWGEEDEDFLALSLKLGDALYDAGHMRGAEVVYKEVLGSSKRFPTLQEQAWTALEDLLAG